MEQDVIKNELKVVLGARCSPGLKQRLLDEAKAVGLSLSEHIENKLFNFEAKSKEAELLTGQLDEAKLQIVKLKERNQTLDKVIAESKNQTSIFQNPQLVNLLSHLKGKSDVINLANGQTWKVTYNSTYELLLAMIYSFRIKQS